MRNLQERPHVMYKSSVLKLQLFETSILRHLEEILIVCDVNAQHFGLGS